MDSARIRLGHAPGEVAPNTKDDFEWVAEHRQELLERYGECIILVYNRRVIGAGQTIEAALAQAEENLPSEIREATPITYFLYRRHPFLRVRPTEPCVF